MIWLFTDFGREGPYVGQMSAVLHREAPGVPVVDLLADAPTFSAKLSAHLLPALVQDARPGDVVLVVVDPGVGSARRPIVVEADGVRFVGPDNGLFELILRRAQRAATWTIAWRPKRLSASFHGRDLFAPIAARLALGKPPPGPAEPATRFSDWPDDLPAIIYVDAYGNAMTGLRAPMLPEDTRIEAGGALLNRASTFSDVPPGTAFWYENSSGLAEIALNGGSAARSLALSSGTPLALRTA